MMSLLKLPRAGLVFSLVAVAGLLVFGTAVGVLMQPAAAQLDPARMGELVCFQLAFTPERAADVVLSFPEESRAAIGQLLIPGDFALAWGYGLVLFGLLGLMTMRLPESWQPAGAILMFAPLFASLFDCIENLFLYAIVQQLVADPEVVMAPILPILAGTAATTKWIALSLISPLYGAIGIIQAARIDRRFSSWVVYVLLFISLASMVNKPITDIPACF